MSIAYADVQPIAKFVAKTTNRSETQTAVMQCLIVSDSYRRSEMFERAAADSGWESIACGDPDQAMLLSHRHRFQLVIVDIDTGRNDVPPGYQELVEQWTGRHDMLMVVCGSEEDALQEIWARQLGTWLYLPGVDETCDLQMVCGEARKATEKMAASVRTAPQGYARTA